MAGCACGAKQGLTEEQKMDIAKFFEVSDKVDFEKMFRKKKNGK